MTGTRRYVVDERDNVSTAMETVKECGDRLLEEKMAVADGKPVQAEKTRLTALAIGGVAL